MGTSSTPDYETILQTVHRWPPARRLRFVQDVLKTLGADDLQDSAVEPAPRQIAEDVRTALREYSAGHLYEIRDANDLTRLLKDSDDDSISQTDPDA